MSESSLPSSWDTIEKHEKYQSFDHDTRKQIRSDYFDQHMSKHPTFQGFDKETQERARNDWIVKEPEFLPSQGGDSALERGTHNLKSSTGFAGHMTAQNFPDAAKNIAESVKYQKDNPSSPEGRELMKAWDTGKGIAGGLKEVAKEMKEDFSEAPTAWQGLKETVKNVKAMGAGIVEQTPNMIPPMAGLVGGGLAGSPVGPVGTITGGFTGASAGNAMVEGQDIALDAIQKAGINPLDERAVTAFLERNAGALFGKTALKSGIIGAVDTATMGAGHFLLSSPGKLAAKKALTDMGIDLANKSAVKAAVNTSEFMGKIAADVTFQATQRGVQRVGRNAGAAILEPLGEGMGEYLGSGIALGDWDSKNAALEALSSMGQSTATLAGQKVYERTIRPGQLDNMEDGSGDFFTPEGLDAPLQDPTKPEGVITKAVSRAPLSPVRQELGVSYDDVHYGRSTVSQGQETPTIAKALNAGLSEETNPGLSQLPAELINGDVVDTQVDEIVSRDNSEVNPIFSALDRMVADVKNGELSRSFQNEEGDTSPTVSTFPDWFKQKTVRKYNKANDTKINLSKKSLERLVDKIKAGKRLTVKQEQKYDYLKTVAHDYRRNDHELVASQELSNLENEGFEFHSPEQVAVGDLNPGDEIVVTNSAGIPDKLTAQSYTDDGKLILQDGQLIEADPFEQVEIIASDKKGETVDRKTLDAMLAKINEDASLEDVKKLRAQLPELLKRDPVFIPYELMIKGTLDRRAAVLEETVSTEKINNSASVVHGQEVNTNPSEAQKEAGNYKKTHVVLDGMEITIENPAGTTRSGTSPSGKEWSQKMKHDYGYVKGSVGYDKDHVDIFFANGYAGGAGKVHIINQHNQDGSFDEHKAIIGERTKGAARQTYLANYEKGWKGGKSVVEMSMAEFKQWVRSDEPKKGPAKNGGQLKTSKIQKRVTKKTEGVTITNDVGGVPESSYPIEPIGNKSFIVKGVPSEVRATLRAGGMKVPGTIIKGSGIRFSNRQRERVENTLGSSQQKADVQAEIEKQFGKSGFRNLQKKGLANIISSKDSEFQTNAGHSRNTKKDSGKVEGFVDRDRAVFLIQENIAPGEAVRLLSHEIGVHVKQLGFKDSKGFQKILKILERRAKMNSPEGEAIREAQARIPKDTNPEYKAEEALAYLVSDSPEINIVRRYIATLKKFLIEKLGFTPRVLNNIDLQALAHSVLLVEARRITESTPMVEKPSGKEDVRYSVVRKTRKTASGTTTVTVRTGLHALIPPTPFRGIKTKAQELAEQYGVKSKFDDLITYLIDADAPISRVQKKLSKQPEARDYNLIRRLMGKKIADEAKVFDETRLRPLIKHLADNKLSIQDVEELAYALHVPERNLQMRRVNARRYIDAVLLNMTDKESAEWKEKIFDAKHNQNQTLNELRAKRDNYVAIMDSFVSQFPQWEQSIEARKSDLGERVWTDAEVLKETPERLYGQLKNAEQRLESRKKTVERWGAVKDRLAGMTDKEAREVIARWKTKSNYASNVEAVKKLREIGSDSLEMTYNAGELTKDEYQTIKDTYKNHVPLYREDMSSGKAATGRAGVGPLASPIKLASGSTRKVVDVFAHIIDSYQSAISRKHKLEAGKALYDMVKANPDENMWSLAEQDKIPYQDTDGNIRFYQDRKEDDNEVYIKVDGVNHLLSVPKDNPSMMKFMEALKRTPADLGPVLKASQRVNRFLAQLNTSFSPEFMITNFMRDIQTAGVHLEDTAAQGMQKAVFKAVPHAIKGIFNAERGNEAGKWEGVYKEFSKNGGKISWMQGYENVEELAKGLEKELAYKSGKFPKRAKFRKLLKFVEAMNISVENGVRLATYKQLVDKGVSARKAAHTVSNLTVDFTRHGSAGPVLNSLYMFANAGLQGNARMIRAVSGNKKIRKIVGGIVVFGFATNVMGAAFGGDDDDGESYYDKLKRANPSLFERNMIFIVPGSKGKYIKVPMPYGYNVFFVAGNEAASALRNPPGYSKLEGTGRVMTSFLNTFNPIGAATILQTLSPTVTDPIVQSMENKSWHGGDLMPVQNPYGMPKPDSERYWKSVNPVAKFAAEKVNKLTGGSTVKPGVFDISPETIENIVGNYTGSLGRLVKDTLSIPLKAVDEGLEIRDIPFARKLFGSSSEYADSKIYRLNRDKVELLNRELRASRGTEDYRKLAADKATNMIWDTKKVESRLRKLRKHLTAAEDRGNKERAEHLKERILQIQRWYNKTFNQVVYSRKGS